MASHFARWTLTNSGVPEQRLPVQTVDYARNLPERRRIRYLASRTLLAEMMWRIYGIVQLPEVITAANGRPQFADRTLPDFSISYAGNIVAVLLAEEGARAGLGMEIVRAHSRQAVELHSKGISSGEKAWIRAQADPDEAATQLWALRQSMLKLTGEASDHASLQLHPASGRLRSTLYPDIQAVSDVEPLFIWSCALAPASERLYLWEFDGIQSWRRLQDIQTQILNMGPRTLRLISLPPEKFLHA